MRSIDPTAYMNRLDAIVPPKRSCGMSMRWTRNTPKPSECWNSSGRKDTRWRRIRSASSIGMISPPMRDHEKAEQWFRLSAEAGNDFSEYALGKLLLSQKRTAEAMRWLDRAAGHGNPFAQYRLGKLCLTGESVKKDVRKALEYLTAAARQGNPFAQYTLGKLYLLGRDVEQDREQARDWFTRSAAQGNAYAQFFLDRFDQFRDPVRHAGGNQAAPSHEPDLPGQFHAASQSGQGFALIPNGASG